MQGDGPLVVVYVFGTVGTLTLSLCTLWATVHNGEKADYILELLKKADQNE